LEVDEATITVDNLLALSAELEPMAMCLWRSNRSSLLDWPQHVTNLVESQRGVT